jgi:hypothetical protein
VTNHSVGALRCRTFVARPLGGRSELADEIPLWRAARPRLVRRLLPKSSIWTRIVLVGGASSSKAQPSAWRMLIANSSRLQQRRGAATVALALLERTVKATGAATGFPTSFVDWDATRLSWAPVGDDDPGAGLDRDRFVAVANSLRRPGRLNGGRSRGRWGPARIVLRVRDRQAWS